MGGLIFKRLFDILSNFFFLPQVKRSVVSKKIVHTSCFGTCQTTYDLQSNKRKSQENLKT